ncbi:MAG: carbohydrate binding family 9 domain-containing protein [Acidobacteria bacterium]|nr:carbohydrate binding family 9 domain-containing protein [Acidobacteriota bacterium]
MSSNAMMARRRSPILRSVVSAVLAGAAAVPVTARVPSEGARARIPGVIEAMPVALPADTIHIDGVLSERGWNAAVPVSDFVQREPSEGAAPTYVTDVKVLFDRTSLYVGVHAQDPDPQRLVGILTRRDEASPSDWVSVLVDSYHDRRTAYEFGVNPTGVKFDAYWFNDTNSDRGWDAVWDVAVSREADGWRAEFRIPFSQLRFNGDPARGLGFAVVRRMPKTNETVTWPLLAKSASGYVSSFGELRGVAISDEPKRLELMPYVLAETTTAPVAADNPLTRSPASTGALGVDLKYRITSGLTLTAAVNPDFGQVEADPAVVNLGAFETYFEERRPFFVEGSGNFSFNNVFYSRRIGRAPQRSVSAPDGGFAAQPANSTVLGAAKVTGRVGKFAVGAMHAVTAAERAEIVSGTPSVRSTSAVEPLSQYTVARVSREFDDNSRVSVMATSTLRQLDQDLSFLPDSAVVGVVDGDWRLADGRYSLQGYWSGSTVRGSAEAIDRLQISNVHSFQRPDARTLSYDPLRTQLDGQSAGVSFSKISGQRTRGNVNAGFRSPGYDVNDLGFQRRADEIWSNAWFQIRSDKQGKHVRNKNINFNNWWAFNHDGDRRDLGVNVNSHWAYNSGWAWGTGVNVFAERFEDRLTRGGPGGYIPGGMSQWGYLDTDNRRLATGNLFLFWGYNRQSSKQREVTFGVTLRPSAALSVNPRVEWSRNQANAQWVEAITDDGGATRYVFGQIDQTSVGVSVRASYTIRPTLTLQVYARPFVSSGAYSSFRELVDGRAPTEAERYAPFAYSGSPDFNYLSFRTTNVLRWEYRPGSTLFVVWQQGRETVLDDGAFRFGRNFGETFDAPSTNVFLIKLSRWINF